MSSIENLMGSNPQFNSVLSRLENLENDAVSNLEATASTAVAAAETQLSNLTNDLRAIVPEGFSVPNVSLQSQLQSLSGLVDPTQSANLLASITTDFGDALSASGFSLDTLVSDAKSAFDSGNTLSGVVPNFEKSPLGDVFQKANAVKLPDINPVVEKAATFVSNEKLTNARENVKTFLADHAPSTTLPTTDQGVFKVTTKTKKVTQSQGGVAITKSLTTATEAVEVTTTGGEETVTRRNISSEGFANRISVIKQRYLKSRGDKFPVTLKHKPIKIPIVIGAVAVPIPHWSFGGKLTKGPFKLVPFNDANQRAAAQGYPQDMWIYDSDNNTIELVSPLKYDYEKIEIAYYYNETYDPGYAKREKRYLYGELV